MTPIAVIGKQKVVGFDGPSADWRLGRGVNAEGKPVPVALEVRDLREALKATHQTDAHLVCYLLRDADGELVTRLPRLRKVPAALEALRSWGYTITLELLAADVDNEAHAPWASDAAARARCAEVAALLPTAGVYASRAGLRIVQPLTRAIAPDLQEQVAEAWREQLGKLGIHADPSCSDWTRLQRLPHIRRDGRPSRSPSVLLDGMTPIEPPEPMLAPFLEVPARRRNREPRIIGPIGPVDDSELARAFEAAGWLGQSIGASKRAARCPWESSHTIGDRFDTSTILFGPSPRHPRGYFHCSHGHCAGRMQIEVLRELPAHARALIVDTTPPAAPNALETTIAALVDAIRKAPPSLTVIQAQCGLGKTTAAQLVAIERAQKTHATAGEHSRAPIGSKTAIAVPTHKLAIQIAGYLRAQGIAVRRFYGPLSVQRDDGSGEPECRFHAEGRPLANGGQSIPFQFCDGRGVEQEACEHRSTCKAYGGCDGPDDARIAVGPHTLLGELDDFAGTTGMLVIDEPPTLLETLVLSPERLEAALAGLMFFGSTYADVMRPALEDVLAWVIGPAPLDTLTTLDAATAVDVSTAFPPDNRRGTAPPLRPHYSYAARRSAGLAQQLGTTSEVLLAVHHALTSKVKPAVRVEIRAERRVLVITAPNEALIRAVTRDGPCVVTDANADLHLPILARVVGYEPAFHRFSAPDGAQVTRTIIRTRGAGRKSWLDGGRFTLDGGALQALEHAVRWILEAPTPNGVGIIAPKLLRLVFDAALGADVSAEWKAANQRAATLGEAAAEIAPLLAQISPKPLLGHYGALRGLDSWKLCDALVTFGDPWPNLADAQHDVDFLGLPESWEVRYEALARAELEQAHGRIRAVHRRSLCRSAHVGVIYPGGWPDDAEVRHVEGGRPKVASAMPLDELRLVVAALGGTRPAARAMSVSAPKLQRWLTGQGVTMREAQQFRSLALASHTLGVSETPYLRSLDRGFPIQATRPSVSETPYKQSLSKGLPIHSRPDDDDPSPRGRSRPSTKRNGRVRPRLVDASSSGQRIQGTPRACRRVLEAA